MSSPDVVSSLRALEQLPGVAEAVAAARDACTELRWHQALRRRIPEAAAESRVRGARASAALDGAEVDVAVVRDLMRGALAWPDDDDAVMHTMRAAVQCTAETEHVRSLVGTSPAQALARLHVAAGAPLLPADEVGRPRVGAEDSRELVEVGPAPAAAEAVERLRGLADVVAVRTQAPALIVAAVAHAEVATVRPFVRGNALVARGFERALLHETGLDPTGVVVPELGHGREGVAGYAGALAAYASGSSEGVALWLKHCAESVQRGAQEGLLIADAVLAGRLG